MNDISELFWRASLEDIKQGYTYNPSNDEFICLICGESFTNGLIYQDQEKLYEARKYTVLHISRCHQSVFHVLLNLDKKLTGLTDHQKTILELFYAGYSDNEVTKTLNTGSVSTIRNHRFSLREKQKQAKIFLTIMELLEEKLPKKQTFIDFPLNTKQLDDRFAITEQDNEKILAAYFKQGPDGPLETFPVKEKKRVAILKHIINYFSPNKLYTEPEVNAVLKKFYDDYVLIRRNLIDYGFMERKRDGSSYWRKA